MTDKRFRSRVNVNFRILGGNSELEEMFISEAESLRIINIAGHPKNPGIRISMYNAMPVEGVALLCDYMYKFLLKHPFAMSAKL